MFFGIVFLTSLGPKLGGVTLQKDSIIPSIKAFIKKYPKLTRFLANYVDNFYEDYSAYKLFFQRYQSI